jgi:hypothetical protein
MYIIERLESGDWKLASSHTQLVDAEEQWDRFIDSGIDVADLRKVGW